MLHSVIKKLAGLIFIFTSAVLFSQQLQPEVWAPEIPEPLLGPYIIEPEILAEFDRSTSACANAGRLNFQCLIYRDSRAAMKQANLDSNPFTIPVFAEVLNAVKSDVAWIKNYPEYGGADAQSMPLDFLTFAGSKIELVGIVNRMDRQFNRDLVPEHNVPLKCGEISAIYRFGYEGDLPASVPGERHYQSRLPVTMNIVFPAVPWTGKVSCAEVARRWLDYVNLRQSGADHAALLNQAKLLVSTLRPQDVDRIELNMQGSRVPAAADETDFGTLGTYIIRVFRWVPGNPHGQWKPSYLTNQIDRARLLGKDGDENTCKEEWGKKLDKKDLVSYLLSMNLPGRGANGMGDVDNGLLNIPQPFLACRAISISPGGAARSGNQPFWNDPGGTQQVIDDSEIENALSQYRKAYPNTLSFVGTADEFRTRLNEMSCSGCHQTRAIAGFHLPGADRAGTSSVNAVYLPGSPHFFGDQLRRMEILRLLSNSKEISRRVLAASYTARPQNRFASLKPKPNMTKISPTNLQLVGGWGGACLAKQTAGSVRAWPCASHLECRKVFSSANQPEIGICVNPNAQIQIGEAMQTGRVKSTSFGFDKYTRTSPVLLSGTPRNTTIATEYLQAGALNSYFAAHQEYYAGSGGIERNTGESDKDHASRVRDQGTGGFPAGSLRLSECTELGSEATCALLASSGFNKCLAQVGAGTRTPESCFGIYTSYAGVRACDPANPCRDDYICLRPMGYTAQNAGQLFDARSKRREAAESSIGELDENRKLLKIRFYGETMPDQKWLGRNGGVGDRRGVCIPPYFVFQFKADGHKVPTQRHQPLGTQR